MAGIPDPSNQSHDPIRDDLSRDASLRTAITLHEALRLLLSPERQAILPELASLLAQVISRALSPEQASSRLVDKPALIEAIRALTGQRIEASGLELRFGGDTITIGNIVNSKAVAAGSNATAINLEIVVQYDEQAYRVTGLKNPYLGLQAFTYADRDIFAGREDLVNAALAKLTAPGKPQTILFITGASGSGKSSFAQAGLVPKLEEYYQKQHFCVRRAVMRPGEKPLAALAEALHGLGIPPDDAFAAARPFMRDDSIPAPSAGCVALLVIDQFEELFTLSESDQRDTFIATLENLPAFDRLRMHVIATLRADYLPELFAYEALYNIAKGGIDMRVMTADELESAIQRPLQQRYSDKGKRFEPALLQRLVADAAADATLLPLLQVTLAELWDKGSLTLAKYDYP